MTDEPMTDEQRRVDDAIAAVFKTWLREHGYPIVADDQLIPIGWLHDQLELLRTEPEVKVGRATPRTAWLRAIGAVHQVLYRYLIEVDKLAEEPATKRRCLWCGRKVPLDEAQMLAAHQDEGQDCAGAHSDDYDDPAVTKG